jgi:hypothetical protein
MAWCLTLGIFIYFFILGYATHTLCDSKSDKAQAICLSPAIGIAVLILLVFSFNRLGYPVHAFGAYLFYGLFCYSLVVLWSKYASISLRKIWPLIAILLGALLWTGYPLLMYGYDWVSYASDDMANYCLSALRFLHHGYGDIPTASLKAGLDYTESYWFMHVVLHSRAGSEEMLAFWWAVTHLNAHQLFMPVILSLHMSLICATAGLVIEKDRLLPGYIAAFLMAISPLSIFGVVQQLIGQVGGLTLLCASILYLYRSISSTGQYILAGLVLASLCIWYPEVLPFVCVGWVIYMGCRLYTGSIHVKTVAWSVVILSVLILLFLRTYVWDCIVFMWLQVTAQKQILAEHTIKFPYYLMVSGIPTLLGFWGIVAGYLGGRRSIVLMGFSVMCIGWLGYSLWRQLNRRCVAYNILCALMGVIFIVLFIQNKDFALFKLAMYIQPFLIAVAAITIASWSRKEWYGFRGAFFGIAVFLQISVQMAYVLHSIEAPYFGITELPNGSSLGVNQQFHRLMEKNNERLKAGVISDATSPVLAKYETLYTQGVPVYFPSRDFFENIQGSDVLKEDPKYKADATYHQAVFEMGRIKNYFQKLPYQSLRDKPYLETTQPYTIFNRYQNKIPHPRSSYFQIVSHPKNRLLFVHSDLGRHYYSDMQNHAALFQFERDVYFPEAYFSGLGRYLLFQVIHPIPKSRLTISLTSTFTPQFGGELPHPKIWGQSSTQLDFVGRGSGRIISEPVPLTYIENTPYLSVDMQRDGKRFPNPARGLMRLYGRDIQLDQRLTTVFGRDISLIDNATYQHMQRPSEVSRFPKDLMNPNLEYSGVYETGALSEHAFFILSAPPKTKKVRIKGTIPRIHDTKFGTMVTVSLNHKPVFQKTLFIGNFDIVVPVSHIQGKQRIDIIFDRCQTLPGSEWVVGALLQYIGFS